MEELNHVNAVRLWQKEDFVNILEHNLVVMRLAVKLA
jgi:hypothetical protein